MPKRKPEVTNGKSANSSARQRSRTMFATLKSKLRRHRGGSMDCEDDQFTELSHREKCATLPARVSSLEKKGGGTKPRTLFWMVDVVDELEGSLNGAVTREDSEESVDSGFHQVHKTDDSDFNHVNGPRVSTIYVGDVEKAFGPMKDVGRWYSTYSSQNPQYESRYVNRPLKQPLKMELDEDERLASRPLPPIPKENGFELEVSNGGNYSLDQPAVIRPSTDSVYERVEHRLLGSNELHLGLRELAKHGWYWGPISRVEAEERLSGAKDGTFLVRDSSDDRYLLSLSFRSQGKTLHTRIEHCNGHFSFYSFPDSDSEGYDSVVDLIQHSMDYSRNGVFCFSRARALGSPAVPVRLLIPFSRFNHVRSLQHYCRFVIRQSIRFDMIRQLPLPRHVHGYLEQSQF